MQIKKLISFLEKIAPAAYQESYDNAGLLVGSPEQSLKGVLVCLDSTEAVIKEAKQKNCNLVIAHHPIIFRGLKKLNGKNYIERTIISAIKNDIAIYAIHTNLDNVIYQGVNSKIGEKLGLTKTKILAPKSNLKKLSTYVPITHAEMIRKALFKAGVVYEESTFSSMGIDTYFDYPADGKLKLEVHFQGASQGQLLKILADYIAPKEFRYEIIAIENQSAQTGSGLIGDLPRSADEKIFLKRVKKIMKSSCVRHTALLGKKIKRVAVCGGAGSFLLPKAIAQNADIFITADYKYHEFFDADGRIIIADIGHFESERYTIDLLSDIIKNKFSTFAVHCTDEMTNPVHYLT